MPTLIYQVWFLCKLTIISQVGLYIHTLKLVQSYLHNMLIICRLTLL